MSKGEETGKIMQIRTFADDVKSAQNKTKKTKIPTPPKPTKGSATATTKKADEEKKIIPEPETAISEGSIEIPPFHLIRASSPDDTSYTNEKTITQNSEVKETLPVKRDPIPTHKLDVDTDIIDEQKQSVLSNRDGIFDGEEAIDYAGEGSIVTDRKHKPFHLFSAIASELNKWFGVKKEAVIEAHKPKHMVVKSSKRKGVIKAAANLAKQAPTDDHEGVAERLKEIDRVTSTEGLQIKKTEEVPKPEWGHLTEDESKSLEAIESLEKAIGTKDEKEVEKIEEPALIQEDGATKENTFEKIENEQVSTFKEVEESDLPEKISPKEPTPIISQKEEGGYSNYRETNKYTEKKKVEVIPEPTPIKQEAAVENQIIQSTDEEDEKPKWNKPPVPKEILTKLGKPKNNQEEKVSLVTLSAVIISAVILGSGASVWYFTSGESAEISTAPEITLDVNGASSEEIEIGEGRKSFFTSLLKKINDQSSGITEFNPSINGAPASVKSIVTILLPSAPGGLGRAVTKITFGGHDGTEPFIVIRFTSFDTVFSGMLQWESTIQRDLFPLFGEPVFTRTNDSRTNNKDVRVMKNNEDQDIIVYGFVDKNTLLISSNINTYSTIADQIQ